jgi:hypothetical protein
MTKLFGKTISWKAAVLVTLFSGGIATAQWPNDQDGPYAGFSNPADASNYDGSEFSAPLLTIPFGSSSRPRQPFDSDPIGPTGPQLSSSTPSQYNSCLTEQIQQPSRNISCGGGR